MINQAIAELRSIGYRTRRNAERESALAANARDYNLSPESLAALDRGDRQRATGVYESKPTPRYAGRYLGTLSMHWPNKRAELASERVIYWRVREALGSLFVSDYGKRVYESDGVIQVESHEQRERRLAI